MHSKTPPRNRLAKVLPEEWRKHLVAHGVPKRKYTAVLRATLAGGRVVEEMIVEEGWIVALDRAGPPGSDTALVLRVTGGEGLCIARGPDEALAELRRRLEQDLRRRGGGGGGKGGGIGGRRPGRLAA